MWTNQNSYVLIFKTPACKRNVYILDVYINEDTLELNPGITIDNKLTWCQTKLN